MPSTNVVVARAGFENAKSFDQGRGQLQKFRFSRGEEIAKDSGGGIALLTRDQLIVVVAVGDDNVCGSLAIVADGDDVEMCSDFGAVLDLRVEW